MDENRRLKILNRIAVINLLLPTISFIVLFNLPRLPEFIEILMLFYLVICLVIPPVFGTFLLVNHIMKKTGASLLLSILNIVSPLWSLFFLVYLTFRNGGFSLPIM